MRAALLASSLVLATSAQAWSDLGHAVTALIAYRHLTPKARVAIDQLLAADTDALTPADFASRAAWADKYRSGHRDTAAWHFVNIEIDAPDMDNACFKFPRLASGRLASRGIAADCIVNKIDEFYAELKDPRTIPAERALAFKFLLHLMGDLHQPLHVADHSDRGGNCVQLSPPVRGSLQNLHAYWDVAAVSALGDSAQIIAQKLDAQISGRDLRRWGLGNSHRWAQESFEMGRRDAYSLPLAPTCQQPRAVSLSDAYQRQAARDAALQLQKAGIRIALLLNAAFSR